ANGINGDTSLYQLEKDLRKGNQQHHWSYRFSKNRQDDITDLVCKEIDRFTRRLVANVTSTLKNLNSIDTLFFTGKKRGKPVIGYSFTCKPEKKDA
ncbi:hypothetical protein ACE5SQ_18945, partial [Lactiplantibacillus plantarum]